MESRYLLDTNICIYIRQRKPPEILHRFEKLNPGEAAISVITYGELLYGAEKSRHRTEALERLRELVLFLPALPLPEAAGHAYGKIRAVLESNALPLPEAAGHAYGKIRAVLESKGELIGNNDLWIAAHAMAERFTLVTNNEREFRRVSGLKIQNWAA